MSEQFQYPIDKSQEEAKSISLAHTYMTTHLTGLVQPVHDDLFSVTATILDRGWNCRM